MSEQKRAELYLEWKKVKESAPLKQARQEMNERGALSPSPWVAIMPQQELDEVLKASKKIVQILQGIVAKYSRTWDSNPDHPLVKLVESCAEARWLKVIGNQAPYGRLANLTLDFHPSGLIEINTHPPIPLCQEMLGDAITAQTEKLGLETAGEACSLETVARRFIIPNLDKWDRRFCSGYGLQFAIPKAGWWSAQLRSVIENESDHRVTNLNTSIGRAQAVWLPPYGISRNILEWAGSGEILVLPPPRWKLLGNKRILAALSNPLEREQILGVSPGLNEKINGHVLWTRVLDEPILETVELMVSEGVSVAAKPFKGSGARGVKVLWPGSNVQRRLKHLVGRGVVQQFREPWEIPGEFLYHDLRIYVCGKDFFPEARIFTGRKMNLNDPETGAAPVLTYRN